MLNWFYRWLGNRINHANSIEVEPDSPGLLIGGNNKVRRVRQTIAVREDTIETEPITFKMYKASGGWAIEFRQYDPKNDRVDNSLYVVSSEDELGKHISQIITMEALKR